MPTDQQFPSEGDPEFSRASKECSARSCISVPIALATHNSRLPGPCSISAAAPEHSWPQCEKKAGRSMAWSSTASLLNGGDKKDSIFLPGQSMPPNTPQPL